MKTLHLPIFTILIAFLVVALSFPSQDAHAMSITVHTDKSLYNYGDTYTISGKVNPVVQNQVVSIVILSPNYPHPSSLSITPNSDGNYSYALPLTIKDVSSGNFTVIAQYGISKNQTTFSYNGPPCVQQNDYWYNGVHSAPASNPRVVDSLGNAITGTVKSGQQIQITSDLANGKNCAQTFAYIVQIQDLNGVTFSLSWITGTLLTGQSLNPAQSWTPTTAGVYTVQIFTWQSLDNPNALAPPLTTTISVEDDANLTQSSRKVSEISPKLASGSTIIILDSPLKQLEGGTDADQIKCNQGLQLIFKQENMSPICVKPDTSKILIERSWATSILGISFGGPTYAINDTTVIQKENSTSSLKLYMSTDFDIIKPGHPIGISISVNNTLGTPVDVASQNNWLYQSASTGPCFTIGYGVSILDGFYDASNMTGGKILNIFNPGILCPAVQETAKVYQFQPQSGNVKNVQCKEIEGMQCRTDTYQMGQGYKFDGYWDAGAVKPFKSGVYTIVGADEWGHVALDHFVVTNNTVFAGRLGSMSCPMTQGGIQIGATIKNSTGFAHYYNSEQYGTMFFLHPSETGTISVQYDAPANASWFQNNNNEPLNMTNGAALYYMADAVMGKATMPFAISLYTDNTGHHSRICHYDGQYTGHFTEPCNEDDKGDIPPSELPYASTLLRSGMMTSFEPNSVMLYPGSTPVFTVTVSASPDAMIGTYWLSLERDLCGPGVLTHLVVLPSDEK